MLWRVHYRLMTTANEFAFCTTPGGAMVTASVIEADPGTHFLVVENGVGDVIECSIEQGHELARLITTALKARAIA